jgi:ribosomal protein S18 acetylase RimI-like enzyme
MAVDAGDAARALSAIWELLATAGDGWTVRKPGAVAAVTNVPFPAFNVVIVETADPQPEVIAGLLDRVAGMGLPHCLQFRSAAGPILGELAAARGMSRDEDVPLMVLEDAAAVNGPAPQGLTINRIAPQDAELHAIVAAAGFEAPETIFREVATPEALSLPGVRCYLGEVAGTPVTTGFAATVGDSVGIFNIATPPEHRRRGYGTAVTAQAIRDGAQAGAAWAWLQSSQAGYNVYERLGFRTIESWACWIAADPSHA